MFFISAYSELDNKYYKISENMLFSDACRFRSLAELAIENKYSGFENYNKISIIEVK